MTDYAEAIAENIRKYRKLRRLTQADMADKLMIDVQYYSQLERGKRNFTIDRIIDSCEILDVRIEDIVHIDRFSKTETAGLKKRITKKNRRRFS